MRQTTVLIFTSKCEHCQKLIHFSITLLQVLETVRENLGKVLYDHMTNVVLNATQTDPSDNSAYFDDFLGDGDLDFFTNRTKVSHKVQSNFNGSNTFWTMKISSRQG